MTHKAYLAQVVDYHRQHSCLELVRHLCDVFRAFF